MKRGAAAMLLLLSGCDLSMTRQDRHQAQSSPSLWPGGPAVSAPDGSVAQDQPARDTALAQPPPVTLAVLERGRERYTIYCTPCHGADGAGRGPVVLRGFPQPLAFCDPHGGGGSAARVVDVVSNGYGVMYGFADRVEPADRWAIAAYVRLLAQSGSPNPSPSGEVAARRAKPVPAKAGRGGGSRPAHVVQPAPSVSLREPPPPRGEDLGSGSRGGSS